MWYLDKNDLHQFKGAGGELFMEFVDRLIRAEAAVGGLLQSEVATQLRANIPDGGVDTATHAAIPRDTTGWFASPTCWQYKAMDAKDFDAKRKKRSLNDLQKEIRKPHAVELIRKGYAYRLCILGDVSPQKQADWEKLLLEEVNQINPDAPDPMVVHGADLLHWTENFPAVVLWLRRGADAVLHLEAWAASGRDLTPEFVQDADVEVLAGMIKRHVDFGEPCIDNEAVLPIVGVAGVGKTRLVLETLIAKPEAWSLVAYTFDENNAVTVAVAAANDGRRLILVADECGISCRLRLNAILRGHTNRVRVISISNSIEVAGFEATSLLLAPPSRNQVGAILEANYPTVPMDRRHQYASMCDGFVRAAIFLCENDEKLQNSVSPGSMRTLDEYVKVAIGAERLRFHSLIALFDTVGHTGDMGDDLDVVAKLTGIPKSTCVLMARDLKAWPGFLVEAGRFWYVTPEIVARMLFMEGWTQFVRNDLGQFLSELPQHLPSQLIQRTARFGGDEARAELTRFFREWFDGLSARQLRESRAASLAASIIEMQPGEFLPKLRVLLESADAKDVLAISGPRSGRELCPRRILVSLLEDLVSFAEFFVECEACLFRLALFETEPGIGNNATCIWQELYCIYASGTEAPFDERLRILAVRSAATTINEASLAFQAISRMFGVTPAHVIGRPLVAGRLRPRDWEPKSRDHEHDCLTSTFNLCVERANVANNPHRSLAIDVVVKRIGRMLWVGLVDDVARAVARMQLSPDDTLRLVHAVDEFVVHCEQTQRVDSAYVEVVRGWAVALTPTDFRGRFRRIVSRDPWDPAFRDNGDRRDELDALIDEIQRDAALLDGELDWLATESAKSCELIGFRLAFADKALAFLENVLRYAVRHCAAPLLRGYLRGMAARDALPTAQHLGLATELEQACPVVAADVFTYAGDGWTPFDRVVSIVEAGRAPITMIIGLAFGIGPREATATEIVRLLGVCNHAAKRGDNEAAIAGIRMLSLRLSREEGRALERSLGLKEGVGLAWVIAEEAIPLLRGHVCGDWIHVVRELAKLDANRACGFLGMALVRENLEVERRATELLAELSTVAPTSAMAAFGNALLDSGKGWRLQTAVLRELVEALPTDVVLAWTRKQGLEGARRIARHLPLPNLNEAGDAMVPDVLDRILIEFDDDDVFFNFVAGAHSGEMWWGNAAEQFREAAKKARRFLAHPNRRIQQWAKIEVAHRNRMAEREDQDAAERELL